MKTSPMLTRTLTGFLVFQLFATVSVSGAPSRKMNLPPVVAETVRAEARGGEIEDVDFTVDDGRPAYEVDLRRDGVERSIEVGADGTLLTRQVFAQELPANVQNALAQLQRIGPVGDIYWIDDDGEFTYAVEVTQQGVKRYFTLDLSGWLLAIPADLSEAPYAIQKTIQTVMGQGTLISIDRVDDYGEKSVEVTMMQNGRRRTFDLDLNGALLDEQVYLDEIPPAAAAALQKFAGNARLAHVEISVEDGQKYFEGRVVNNGVAQTLTVGQDGTVASVEIAASEAPEAVRRAMQQRQPGARLLKLEKVNEGTSFTYEAELTANGLKIYLSISEDGNLR